MKKILAMILLFACTLAGCSKAPAPEPLPTDTIPVSSAVVETTTRPTVPTETEPTVPQETTHPTEVPTTTVPPATDPPETEATLPPVTEIPAATQPTTEPPATEPPATAPPATEPTQPPATEPTQPETTPATQPEETIPPTEPEETTPPKAAPTAAFKQEVAYYAAYYINQYRTAAGVPTCTVLPGMTQVAQYRASQLTYNYAHDTVDKREALAYYQYGRWVDATIVGLDPSASYYEADTSEAICAGFGGKTSEEMGKYIADLCRNSSSHWSYIGSAKNLYIGIGVEYRAGSTYGWYGCIMVGRTNYG